MAKRSRSSSRIGLVLAGLAAVAACRGPRDPIQGLLAELEAAAEAKDAAAIEAKLTEDFRTVGGQPRIEVRSLLQRYFFAYESINVDVHDVEVQRDDDADVAHARFVVDFNGRPKSLGSLGSLLPPSAVYRFDLDLRRTGKRWLVSGAAWEDLTGKEGVEARRAVPLQSLPGTSGLAADLRQVAHGASVRARGEERVSP